jgi:dynein heavy chain
MSPVGEGFRSRCLRFPALVNCCTIDWFFDWPEEALLAVSHIFLDDRELSGDPDLNTNIAKMSVDVHVSVTRASRVFFSVRAFLYYVACSLRRGLLRGFSSAGSHFIKPLLFLAVL